VTATEGASSKKTLGINLSGRKTTIGRDSGESVYKMPPKGNTLVFIELNSQVKGQRRGCLYFPFLSFFLKKRGIIGMGSSSY
jgi:hypothetical protein